MDANARPNAVESYVDCSRSFRTRWQNQVGQIGANNNKKIIRIRTEKDGREGMTKRIT